MAPEIEEARSPIPPNIQTPQGALDNAWDAVQRRLFHRIAASVDAEDQAERDAADRLRAALLAGTGTAQTQLDFNAEVDFGRQQIKLTQDGGHLAADVKKLKLGDALAAVEKATEALAQGLGRGSSEKRKPPSRQLRDALAECSPRSKPSSNEPSSPPPRPTRGTRPPKPRARGSLVGTSPEERRLLTRRIRDGEDV